MPLVFDPLISAYQKEVFERRKWPPGSPPAVSRRKWESRLFARADVLVADTPAHAGFFREYLDVPPERIRILYVSAEDDRFRPLPYPRDTETIEVLFYGSFLPLQGVDVIIRAARLCADTHIRWVLLGDGGLRPAMEELAAGMPNISFEPWMDYELLPQRLGRAHVILGIFGVTPKADMVIPNKLFQAMAAGRPVITRHAGAYRGTLAGSTVIGWVPPGDPAALAGLAASWAGDVHKLAQRGRETRKLFDTFFGRAAAREGLRDLLDFALTRIRQSKG